MKSPLYSEMTAHPRSAAFSLIEVTIALGIVAFALVSVVALLPMGLGVQRQAVDQAFAAQVLNDVSQALQGVHLDSNKILQFPAPLNSLPVQAGVNQLPFYEDGSLTNTSVARRGTLFIDQKLALGSQQPVYVSVAWGPTAERSGIQWIKSQGSLDTFLYIAPR